MAAGTAAALRPYGAYKDSGVAWLPSIPQTWSMQGNGRMFEQRNETGRPELPVLEVSLRTGVRVRDFGAGERKQAMDDRAKYKVAHAGDLAYNMMRMWQGAVGVVPVDGLVSPAYVVARALDPSAIPYFDLVFHTPAYMREVENWSRGIVPDRNRLYWEAFKQIQTPLPPPDEQDAIIRFVERVDRRVSRYITAKKRLIALLNAQKQATIERALTLGLDPRVSLKSSGVEWLGRIPAHWNVTRLRTLTTSITTGSRGWSNLECDEGPLFLRVGNLSRGSLSVRLDDTVRVRLSEAALREARRTQVRPLDILLSVTAFIGSVAVAPETLGEAYVSQHVACCRLREHEANPHWVGYVLLSSVGQIHGALCMYGGTKQGLSLEDVKNYVVLLPPRREQDAIVTYVEKQTATAQGAILGAEKEINLVREFRARLVADVVTGRLDVREAAAHLPNEMEHATDVPEPLDNPTDDATEPAEEEEALE